MSDTCCPDCGSKNAVSKTAAWDASISVPQKTAKDLESKTDISKIAFRIAAQQFNGGPIDPDEALCNVPASLINELIDQFKELGIPQ